jgi:hypothetical protein
MMAIIVPSKHIYSTKSKKIKKNAIDKISVLAKTPIFEKQSGTQVYTGVLDEIRPLSSRTFSFGYDKDEGTAWEQLSQALYIGSFAAVRVQQKISYALVEFFVPIKKSSTEKVLSVSTGEKVGENGETTDMVTYTLYGTTETVGLRENVSLRKNTEGHYYATFGEINEIEGTNSASGIQQLTTENPSSVTVSAEEERGGASASVTSGLVVSGLGFSSSSVVKDSIGTPISYAVTMYVPQYEEIARLSGTHFQEIGSDVDFILEGEKTIKRIQRAEFNVKGEKIVLSFGDEIVTIGDGENTIEVDGSTLMHPITAKNYATTLEAYKNGRESITIECDLGEYYNEDGTKAISTKGDKDENGKELPMSFKNGDVLLITKPNEKGEEVPIARKRNGEPMLFYVVGTELTYDGEILQKIFAQEY